MQETTLTLPLEPTVLVSAIEHYSYCPRQCALIHVEQSYSENVFTIRGKLAHQRADSGVETIRADVRTRRDVAVWSERLGLRGKADLIEFRAEGPYPVEYKVGRRRGIHADLQLCAQALCLEEMIEVPVMTGAVFYHAERRRHEVTFSADLRAKTEAVVTAIRQMLDDRLLPPAVYDARCRHCSLAITCLPEIVAEPARIRGYQGTLFRLDDE